MCVQIYDLHIFNPSTLCSLWLLPSNMNLTTWGCPHFTNIASVIVFLLLLSISFIPVALYPELTCYSLTYKIFSNSGRCDFFPSHTLCFNLWMLLHSHCWKLSKYETSCFFLKFSVYLALYPGSANQTALPRLISYSSSLGINCFHFLLFVSMYWTRHPLGSWVGMSQVCCSLSLALTF